jgi:hypothetical protein
MSGLRTTTAIVEAISNKRLLVLAYHGGERLVEPHTFGIDRWGRALLCGYQVEGASGSKHPAGWKFFFVDEISTIRLDDRQFAAPRPEYRRGDGAFKSITAEL